jgi:oligopeptide/dipeptide ABC transporter ATP-binding protein
MYGGTVVEYADCDTIFNAPQHPYTQRLLQAFPDIERPGSTLASIAGSPPRLDDLPPGCRFEPRCQRREEICVAKAPPGIRIAPGHVAACHFVGWAS